MTGKGASSGSAICVLYQLSAVETDILRAAAERLAAIMDAPMSYRNVNAIFKRAEWEQVFYVLKGAGLAIEVPSKGFIMLPAGEKKINQLVPRPARVSPESRVVAGETQHSTGKNAEGEGG